jgi:regulator of cell morphogenesis and NO signaling
VLTLARLLWHLVHDVRIGKYHMSIQYNSSFSQLIQAIEQSHHVYTRTMIDNITQAIGRAHPQVHHTLPGIRRVIEGMATDLLPHMLKEERILFPYILALENRSVRFGQSCFGSVANPIRAMTVEHQSVREQLAQLRDITQHYAQTGIEEIDGVLSLVQQLDEDLVAHMHWEDDVLFPRAIQLETDLMAHG